MPPRKPKPHPRSLDALYGPAKKPKPRVVKCRAGHAQSQEWRPGRRCLLCDALELAREREAQFIAPLPKPTPVHEIMVASTGRVMRFVIPPDQLAQRRARDQRRRGPRRRSSI